MYSNKILRLGRTRIQRHISADAAEIYDWATAPIRKIFTALWVLRMTSGLGLIRFPRHQFCEIRLGLSIIIRI